MRRCCWRLLQPWQLVGPQLLAKCWPLCDSRAYRVHLPSPHFCLLRPEEHQGLTDSLLQLLLLHLSLAVPMAQRWTLPKRL